MDGSSSAAPSSLDLAGATVSFPEENGIVLDKWLIDVCGEEDLQFPSHRRALYPAYIDRLRRISNERLFIANTFDYPSRSGTREVLVLQKTLAALGAEEQALQREINQVQANVTDVRRVLDERTMGASSIVEEEKAQAAKLEVMRAEEMAKAAAKQQQQQQQQQQRSSPSSPAQAAARQQGYVPLDTSLPIVIPTAPRLSVSAINNSSAATTPRVAETPLPMPDAAGDGVPTANSSVSSRSTAYAATTPEHNSFSAIARAARRAGYEKKKALSLRYLVEVQRKAQAVSGQRAEVEGRHRQLLQDKEQLAKEYEALQTTEALVVARHEEAAAHEHEEAALLADETAAYAAAEKAFASIWEELEAGEDTAAPADAAAAAAPAAETQKPEASPAPGVTTASAAAASASLSGASGTEEPPPAGHATACHDEEAAAVPTLLDPSPLDHREPNDELQSSTQDNANNNNVVSTASASLTPAEHDKSPPEATLNTHRPPSNGSNSVASSSAPASQSPPPVERVLQLSNDDNNEAEEESDVGTGDNTQSQKAAAVAATKKGTTASDKKARRAQLEELRHTLSELGAAMQACRRQLLNTSQTHMGRFRQSQQRLKDWQEMAALARATYHQLHGQVEVINTTLQDAAARLDADSAESTYATQLAKLNDLLKTRSYETFEYYMGSGAAAATDVLYDANAEEELRALHRPSPSASTGGMTPLRNVGSGNNNGSTMSSAASTRESSLASAYHTPGRGASGQTGASPGREVGVSGGTGCDAPHKHRSRYELVRHLQRWEAALLTDRLAILKAANMAAGPFSGAGANTRKSDGFNATRCYQELRRLLLQQKSANGSAAAL